VANRLLVKLGLEDARVEARCRRRLGNDDVEMFETEGVEWKHRRAGWLRKRSRPEHRQELSPRRHHRIGPIRVISPPGSLSWPSRTHLNFITFPVMMPFMKLRRFST